LRVDEPVLREALRRAASERRSGVKTDVALVGSPAKKDERRLVRMLMDADDLREHLVEEIRRGELHRGLETERIFNALLEACVRDGRPDLATLAQSLEERDRRLLFEIAFDGIPEATGEEAESCLETLRRRKAEEELASVQRQIEAQPAARDGNSNEMLRLLQRKQELRRRLSDPVN
jgi:hypothetical protein